MKSNPPSKNIKICLVTLVTLFEQPPQAHIRPKSKYFCAHQIAQPNWLALLHNAVALLGLCPSRTDF